MDNEIKVCDGYNCTTKGANDLYERLEMAGEEVGCEVSRKPCSGHCEKGPTTTIYGEIVPGSSPIYQKDDKTLVTFLNNYKAITKIEGKCKKAEGRKCGFAVDIGTTGIKASLVDLETKEIYGKISTLNKQRAYGTTVLHRWNFFDKAKNRKKNLKTLSDIVRKSVDDIQEYFLKESGAEITKTVMAGNTTMTYLYLNKDPLLTEDSKKEFGETPDYTISFSENGKTFLPNIFEWVGADIVSGMTALDFDKHDKNVLLIDLGTNGEVALSTKDGYNLVAAASAGPAFEGAGFRCGMPAMDGAIDKVYSVDGKLHYNIIGGGKPKGLCGSGMLDLIAEMLSNKVMDVSGKLDKKYNGDFTLAEGISINQTEIDYFKRSKAAIYATIQTLMDSARLDYSDLEKICVAGAFGNLDTEKAQYIGLFPAFDKYEFLGNTSLKGAQLCLKDENLERAKKIALNSTPLILAAGDSAEKFGKNYTAARFFPHTNLKLFEKVLERFNGNDKVTKT